MPPRSPLTTLHVVNHNYHIIRLWGCYTVEHNGIVSSFRSNVQPLFWVRPNWVQADAEVIGRRNVSITLVGCNDCGQSELRNWREGEGGLILYRGIRNWDLWVRWAVLQRPYLRDAVTLNMETVYFPKRRSRLIILHCVMIQKTFVWGTPSLKAWKRVLLPALLNRRQEV